MPAGPTPLVFDGFATCESGMNNGLAQMRLGQAQVALLINATARGDYIRQRPPISRVMTILQNPPGSHQHTGWYRSQTGQVFVMVVSGGRFFRVDPVAQTVLEVTIPGDPNPSILMRGWSAQGEMFWVYNDGQSPVFIFDGGGARRAKGNELKPGTVITYNQGRFWYALPDGFSFRATDLVGNQDSGTLAFGFKDSILHETENDFLNEGGDFSVPTDHGEITAMAAPSILDTSQGQGPLQVICSLDGFSVNTPVDRAVWKSVTYPIQTEALIGAGAAGQQSTCKLNGDLFFRDPDNKGIRSFIIARRQFRDFGNTSQSFEVSGILDFDQSDLLTFGAAGVFDNRYLTTCSPVYSSHGVYHRGLIAMDLAPISSIQSTGTPNYDGLWTGINILGMARTTTDLFFTVLEDDNSISLWKMERTGIYDDEETRIQWSLIPRQLFVELDAAGRPIRRLKRLETADLEYDQLLGIVNWRASWAPDSYPCYTEWDSWQECVNACNPSPDCPPSLPLKSGYQPRLRLKEPPDVCVDGIKRPLRNFYSLNVKLDIEGPARLLGFRAGATVQPEPTYEANTCDAPNCVSLPCCGFDYFSYKARTTPFPPYSGSGSGSGGSGGPIPPTPPVPPVPPHVIIPTWPNPPLPPCGVQYFFGTWNFTPAASEIGTGAHPPFVEVDPAVLQAWAADVWGQFGEFAAANAGSFTVSDPVILWFESDAPAPLGPRRYLAQFVYMNPPDYTAAFSYDWVLAIAYCATPVP